MPKGQFADEVREYALKKYILPARAAGAGTVQIRAGDVHAGLAFANRLRLVCAALIAIKFRRENNIQLIRVDGTQSTTTKFTFEL
jgi:hypothetical protein